MKETRGMPRVGKVILGSAAAVFIVVAIGGGWMAWRENTAAAFAQAAIQRREFTLAIAELETAPTLFGQGSFALRPLWRRAWEGELEARLARRDLAGAREAARHTTFAGDPPDPVVERKLARALARAEAEELIATGDTAGAIALAAKLGSKRETAELLRSAGRLAEAVQLLLEMNQVREAAEVWNQAGDPERAAQVLESAGALELAREQWNAAAAQATAKQGFAAAAAFHERAGDNAKARQSWTAAARAELAAGRTEAAIGYCRQAQDWNALLEFLLHAGRRDEAIALLEREVRDPATRAQFNLNLGRRREAANDFVAVGAIDEAVRLLGEIHDWAQAAEVLRRAGRLSDAADLLEKSGDLEGAVKLFPTPHRLARITGWRREQAVRDLEREDWPAIRAALAREPDKGTRGDWLATLASRCTSPKQGIAVAQFAAQDGQWAVAAGLYERFDAFLAARECWENAKRSTDVARVLARAVRAHRDCHLTFEAAKQAQQQRATNAAQLFELAAEQAWAERDFGAFADIARTHRAPGPAIDRLLGFAEQQAGTAPLDAAFAVVQAEELRRIQGINAESQRQAARAAALAPRLAQVREGMPVVSSARSGMTHVYHPDHVFAGTRAAIVLDNTKGRAVARMRVRLVCTERAPDLFFGRPTPGVANRAVPAGEPPPLPVLRSGALIWSWASAAANELFARASLVYRQDEVVTDLKAGEMRTVEIVLSPVLPYRQYRVELDSGEVSSTSPP